MIHGYGYKFKVQGWFFYDSRSVSMVIHGSRWVFMVPGGFSLFFKVPGWLFIVGILLFQVDFMVPGWFFMFFFFNNPGCFFIVLGEVV